VSVCVCLSVCLSGYTFPQFSTDSILLLCTQCARVHVRAKHAHVCIHLLLDGLSQNLLGIYKIVGYVLTTRACIRLLIFGRIYSKFGGHILHTLRTYFFFFFCVWIYVLTARSVYIRTSFICDQQTLSNSRRAMTSLRNASIQSLAYISLT
jgi:hypothetical protein